MSRWLIHIFFFCHSSFRCCCFICLLICLFVSLPVFCFSISHNRLSSTISVHYFIPACIIALVIVSHANSHSSFTKEVFICTTNIYRRRQSVFLLNVNVHTANLFLIHHFLIFVEFLFDFSQIFFVVSFLVYYFGSQIYRRRLHHCNIRKQK